MTFIFFLFDFFLFDIVRKDILAEAQTFILKQVMVGFRLERKVAGLEILAHTVGHLALVFMNQRFILYLDVLQLLINLFLVILQALETLPNIGHDVVVA